jgi:hypothetical protein
MMIAIHNNGYMKLSFSLFATRLAYIGVFLVFFGPLLLAMAWAAFGPSNSYMCPPLWLNITEYTISEIGALFLICSLIGFVQSARSNPQRAVAGVVVLLIILFVSTAMGTLANPVTVIQRMYSLNTGSKGCLVSSPSSATGRGTYPSGDNVTIGF